MFKKFVMVVVVIMVAMSFTACSKSSPMGDSTPIIFNVSPLGCEYNVGGRYDQVTIYWTIQYTNPTDSRNYNYTAVIEWGDGTTSRGGLNLPPTVGGGTISERISHVYDGVEKGQMKTFTARVTFTYDGRSEIDPIVKTLPITITHM